MEEKKLTDEVVVKALEHCSHNRSCEYCYHNDERGSGEIVCRSRLMGKSLDLIHRLQKENEELKSPKFASWKLKFFNLKEEFDKELSDHEEFTKKATAEIERLKIDIKNEKNWGKIQTKQAVKDTAKEIFKNIFESLVFGHPAPNEEYRNGYEQALYDYDEKLRKFAKECYGVEVE